MSENQNASYYFVDRHLSEGRADKVAFKEAVGQKRRLTYGALAAETDRVAGALGRADIRREERAVMIVLDQVEFPQIFWGAIKAGVVPVPINTLLSASVYRAILHDSRAAILFVSQELLPVVEEALHDCPTSLREVVVIGGEDTKSQKSWSSFMDGATPVSAIEASADEVAFWLYSSGSTGTPKGVRHVHGSLQATAETYGNQVLKVGEDDIVFSAAKLFFAYGLGNGMTFPMAVGATTILLAARPTPDSVSDILGQEKPTIYCGVPTLYAALLHHWESADVHPSAPLRTCISAGEALPADIGNKWKSIWGVDILDGVGSTEMLHIFLSNRAGDVVYGTSGAAVPGYELRLVEEDGSDVPVGGVGELLVRGPSAADGYWNQRNKTRATFEGEWTRTGDKYELAEGGRYVYCGRTDDMFKVSGIWVSPFEIEQALVAHPAVLEAAVIAKRDDEGLEKPMAFIVLKAGGDVPDDIKEFVKTKIGKWKYPRWIEAVTDLPKTATGKIQRFKLRESI